MAGIPGTGAADTEKVIPSGSLRITWLSAIAAGVVAAAALFTDSFFDELLGSDASPANRAAVFITVIAAWALIAVADVLARGYASARGVRVVTPPTGLPPATWTSGPHEPGFSIAAIRVTSAADPDYLIVKPGHPPRWVPGAELSFPP